MKIILLSFLFYFVTETTYSQYDALMYKKFSYIKGDEVYLSLAFSQFEENCYVKIKQLGLNWQGEKLNTTCECQVKYNDNNNIIISNCAPIGIVNPAPFLEFNAKLIFDKSNEVIKLTNNNKEFIFTQKSN